MKPLQEQIVNHGGLAQAINVLGAESELTAAFEELRAMTPEVMRGSPEHVVIWASLQLAWERAQQMGDTKEMRAILSQRENMIMRLH